ncbi:sulfatase [Bordetella holmesii]|uniref:sulfatase n=1 Tax=Bordetella holmesii TaxID=35814 RepID=UPI000C76B40E|nr:sulfatase [Bordetella holmesii]AUL20601.1 sulfatase [Bordetella holmesii]AUL51932.1 sulfatase [Bordetella holmesii]
MLESLWLPLLPPVAIGLLLGWLMESLLLPRPAAPWRRPAAANLIHVAVWLVAFGLELALFRRPYFAVVNVLAIQLVIVLVSRAKYQALQEPFVYPDFEYFTDAIKHPRLYVPFFGVWNALAAAAGYGVALWAGLALEPSILSGADGSPAAPGVAPLPLTLLVIGLCVVGVLSAKWAGRRVVVDFDADNDLRRLGLIAALWAYAKAEREPIAFLQGQAPFAAKAVGVPLTELPDLVCIQSESFFDVRRAFPIVKKDVLSNFDQLCAESVAYGQLEVAARLTCPQI